MIQSYPHLLASATAAVTAADTLFAAARRGVAALVAPAKGGGQGGIDPDLFESKQLAAHGLAWLGTYVQGLRQLSEWARRLDERGAFGAVEAAIVRLGFTEYLSQMVGGIPISQCEIIRPADMGVASWELNAFLTDPAVAVLIDGQGLESLRLELARQVVDGRFGDFGLDDETLTLMGDQFTRFAEAEVLPHAHDWHLKDQLIPLPVVEKMAELGVFGLTIPEEFGGLGLGKMSMCLASEILSRAYIGIGSLGTRSEIAGELIRIGGTLAQKERWLPKIAAGEILPTAVFTEPNTGSDLGSLRTRAVRDGDVYRVTGAKTWITHGSRSDLMTLLVRTDPHSTGYAGLSMLLAEKPRGTEADPFPAAGMQGGEIGVLGYRGMKEYEIGFDGFEVPAANLLGEVEGQGFKQLMETFESARIQTGARATGVAQYAMELGALYARDRKQFGKALLAFPRVHAKIAMMAVETMIARQLTYFAAREKDGGHRCDIEAGMAKLLAARVAWSNADCALQIHGGNGYAQEYAISRVLCDARILSVFEGAAEIQAMVIARGLLGRRGN
ncbi:MAG: acyl-CoA dehydrogenase family protein [Magnetospirillum sp.]